MRVFLFVPLLLSLGLIDCNHSHFTQPPPLEVEPPPPPPPASYGWWRLEWFQTATGEIISMAPNVSYLICANDSGIGFSGETFEYGYNIRYAMICVPTGDSQFVVTRVWTPRYGYSQLFEKYRATLMHARRVAYRANQMRFFQDDSTKRIAFRRLW